MDGIAELELRQILDAHEERTMLHLEKLLDRVVYKALANAGVAKSHITKSEAYKRYGRATIDCWIKGGYLRCMKDGESNTRCRISIPELEQVASHHNHSAVVQGKVRTRRTKTGVAYPQK